jgi:hypothetical protein
MRPALLPMRPPRPGARSVLTPCVGLLLAVLLVGCDQASQETSGAVTFDLRSLFRLEEVYCANGFEDLVLTVTDSDGSQQTIVQEVPIVYYEIRVPVRVTPGRVRFSAGIRSNNGTLLYSGTRTVEVTGEGFSVSLPVTPVNAVLIACPYDPRLIPTRFGFEGEVVLHNRGIRDVAWTASPCQTNTFSLANCEGVVEPGSHDLLYGAVVRQAPPFTIGVEITSELGTLAVQFSAYSARPAPPSALLGDSGAPPRPGLLAAALRQWPLPVPPVALAPWTPSP